MAKSVEEVLADISQKTDEDGKRVKGRFSKNSFGKILTTLANDPNFVVRIPNVKKGEIDSIEEYCASKSFRQYAKKLLESAGMDSSESVRVMDDEFEFPNMESLYEFFATALYEYMDTGAQFDLLPREDFKGGIYLTNVDETVTTKESTNPITKENLGMFETTKKKHKEVRAKSSTPDWLKNRRKVQ